MKEKLMEMLKGKEDMRSKLNASMIESESKEERAAIGETLSALAREIADIEDLIEEADEPIEESAKEEGDARMMVVGTMEERTAPVVEKTAAEARAEALVKGGRMDISAEETRATLLTTETIATPTSVGGINEPFNVVSSIVDLVKVEDMTGMGGHKEAYIAGWQTADVATDGTLPTESDPTFKTVAINPFLLSTVSYVSRELRKQTPLQYEAKVREGAMIALRKKLGAWIVGGGGTNEIYGIVNAMNAEKVPASMIETLPVANKIDAHTLRTIVFTYGGDENVGGNAVLFLNKKDLIAFGDVRGGNEKKAIYEIIPDGSNPNTGIIKDGGLSVKYCICSAIPAFAEAEASTKTMLYGDPANYKLGLFGNFEVNVSEDYKFGEGLLTVRGEVMVGGNVVVDKGFVVVTKA